MYENEVAVVLLDSLAILQKLNVAAFLTIAFPETHGAPLVNACGKAYLPYMKHPALM